MSAFTPLLSFVIIFCILLSSWAQAGTTAVGKNQTVELANQQTVEGFVAGRLLLDDKVKDDIASKPITVELIPEPQIYAFATGLIVIGFVGIRKSYRQRAKLKANKGLASP
ncbi:hypothetical protein [Rubellicoccus peritrichatus]|uniref:PEP-CTERM protein-sorting domain-containing protein n=1 Tax=Rubellicoccus peritrichatus TaxID=3080537 RepID=A0AAQ3QXA3_9BACT|nr:hypothetical protein [Puniceicoccus sp. CR14]WOO42675.1 hypothetical protein RZN69_06190 [Puniceicoccus sp. CR14]